MATAIATTSFTPPDRTVEQRMAALALANQVRTDKARLKRDIRAGRVQLEQVLLYPPEYLLRADVWHLLLAVPRWGRVKVNRLLVQARISPSKTVGGLSDRQRYELVGALRRRTVSR